MKLTERELTAALEGTAKSVLATQDKDVRKGRRTPEEAWQALTRYQRYVMLDGLGDQVLPVLVALPDREVEIGQRPTYSDREIIATVEQCAGDDVKGLRGKAVLAGRVALVRIALGHVPPKADPDAFVVPDHL